MKEASPSHFRPQLAGEPETGGELAQRSGQSRCVDRLALTRRGEGEREGPRTAQKIVDTSTLSAQALNQRLGILGAHPFQMFEVARQGAHRRLEVVQPSLHEVVEPGRARSSKAPGGQLALRQIGSRRDGHGGWRCTVACTSPFLATLASDTMHTGHGRFPPGP